MSENEIVIKTLIDPDELKELRRVYEIYKNSHFKDGHGQVGPDGDHNNEVIMPTSTSSLDPEIRDQRAPVIPKKVVVDIAPTALQPIESHSKKPPLQDNLIISQVRKKYRKRAQDLLTKLKDSNRYHHDDLGKLHCLLVFLSFNSLSYI